MYEKGGKVEAAAKEKYELDIMQEYLPAMAYEATVRGWIDAAVAEACPNGPDKKLMGKVSRTARKRYSTGLGSALARTCACLTACMHSHPLACMSTPADEGFSSHPRCLTPKRRGG